MNEISYKEWTSMSDDHMAQQIGQFVKHHRMEQHKTQDMLANDAGISRSTLSLLERGKTVTVATLIQVLRVLDQLQVMNSFTIVRQESPLLLARAEKGRKQRVKASSKHTQGNDPDENSDW